MTKPEDPVDGATFVDDYGTIMEWSEDEEEWKIQSYKFEEGEREAISSIMRFYANLMNDLPDDIAEKMEEAQDMDIDATIDTALYFVAKFNPDER